MRWSVCGEKKNVGHGRLFPTDRNHAIAKEWAHEWAYDAFKERRGQIQFKKLINSYKKFKLPIKINEKKNFD